MNKIDKVFRELEQLYEFQKELRKFRLKKREQRRESAEKGDQLGENVSRLPKGSMK